MAAAIKEAIDNSQLIENQTTHVTQAYGTTSWARIDPLAGYTPASPSTSNTWLILMRPITRSL